MGRKVMEGKEKHMNFKEMENVIEEIRKRDNFLITSHMHPEGDSIGSQLALFNVLKKMGKNAVIVDQDKVPDNLKFLAGAQNVRFELPAGFNPATIIVLDCPVKERIGKVSNTFDEKLFIVNIDHHVSNEFFGDINWVEPRMSSAGEMMYYIIKKLGYEIDANSAQAIYSAIVTDTGMYNYDNTTRATHEIVGELIDAGANPSYIFKKIFENRNVHQVRLLGKVLSDIKLEEDGKLAYICLTRAMLEESGVKDITTDEFIGYPRSIKGVEVAVFFNEKGTDCETVNVSFRSNGDIDVNRIACAFGGGGHKKASGCLMKGSTPEIKEKILGAVKKAIRETNHANKE